MIRSIILLVVTLLILFSCNPSGNKPQNPAASDSVKRQDIGDSLSDTIPRFWVDDYAVTNDMFRRYLNGKASKSGKLVSLDKVWFANDTLRQALVFELYTDYHRLATFHFYTDNIPEELIRRIEFNIDGGDAATNKRKLLDFKGFLPKANRVDGRYFTSEKGFALGDSLQKAMRIYGKPDKTERISGSDIFTWQYEGDQLYDNKTDLHGKPLAKDSFGHSTTMFFKNNKLVAVILYNDIP